MLVCMIYTSGSTGRPKGVMNIHRGLCNRLHWMQQSYQLTPADRVLQKTPFSFDVSVWEFFWPLFTGACLVVARPRGHQDPGYLVSLIAEQKITTLHFVPSMLQVFLMAQGLERCESLKRVICSGEALSVELQERFFSRLDAELHNLYGPTEASIDVTYWKCQRQSHQWVIPICGNISRYDGPNAHCTFEPSTAIRLQQHFGFANALVFDISNACTGLFTAVNIVDAFLKAGLIRRGMVISGEYITHLTQTAQKEIESYMDSRLACLTVGDAGAAMILEQAPGKKVGFHELELYTVSRYYDLCIARATDKQHGGAIMFTDAVRVSAVNMQQAVPFAANMLKRFGWSHDTVQHVIMHQTSKTTINDAAR